MKSKSENGVRVPLYVQTLIAMALGAVAGIWFGPAAAKWGTVGKSLIQLIKVFATPLLFFSVLDSILVSNFRGRSILRLLAICAINSAIAVTIAVLMSHFLQPGKYLVIPSSLPAAPPSFAAAKNLDLVTALLGNLPENIFSPFLAHSIPGVILLAILLGIAAKRLNGHTEFLRTMETSVQGMSALSVAVITWLVKLIPVAVFCVVAQSVGSNGFSALRGLGVYAAGAIGGMFLHIFICYQAWIVFFSNVGLRRFWKEAWEPVVYSLGVNSSLATLPLTLGALDRMGVSKTSARLSACLGTNFNNDGILLYEAFAVLFIAQAYGIELSISQQLTACFICVAAAFGVAGIPEAGVIALTLVLATVGLPVEILPLLLTVDWVVARCRSATNVLGDLTVATVLDRYDIVSKRRI